VTYCPALRPDVVLERAEDGTGALVDPALDRRIELGAAPFALAERIDGRTPVERLLDHPSASRDQLARALRSMMLLHLVDGAGAALLERFAAARRGVVRLEPIALAGARFACQGSGDCCHNYALGPLQDGDIARLEALDLRAAFPALGELPAWEKREDREGRYLRTAPDGGCVFLEEDQRCGLHARFGARSKPAMCGLYPLVALPTVEGIKVYDRGACASFAVSCLDGPPLAEHLLEDAALLADGEAVYHPVVLLADDLPCDYGHFLRLQRAQIALLERRHGGARDTLIAAARLSRGFTVAMGDLPLAPGQPEAQVERALAVDPAVLFRRGGAHHGGLAALVELVDDLRGSLASMTRTKPKEILPRLIDRARDLTRALELVALAARNLADPEGSPLTPAAQIVVGLPLADPRLEEAARISIAQQLFARGALIEERPEPALVRIAVWWLVARYGARLCAAGEGAPAVRQADYSFAHTLASRVLLQPGVEKVFMDHREQAAEILEALEMFG
jgi:Fe-S-cluster containining protein